MNTCNLVYKKFFWFLLNHFKNFLKSARSHPQLGLTLSSDEAVNIVLYI
jgi:hypothetical protein